MQVRAVLGNMLYLDTSYILFNLNLSSAYNSAESDTPL